MVVRVALSGFLFDFNYRLWPCLYPLSAVRRGGKTKPSTIERNARRMAAQNDGYDDAMNGANRQSVPYNNNEK